jgi:membrane-associated PAP2 superfamily phosphatase
MKRAWLFLPLALLVGLSIPFAVSNLDLRIESVFYDRSQMRWKYAAAPLVKFLYAYGTWPVWGAVGVATAILIGSFFRRSLRSNRAAAAFLLTVVALGPGLVVNTLLKPGVARPRPRELVDFGGDQKFLRVGEMDARESGHSYPSGHASMGYVWLGLGVFYAGRRPGLSALYFCAGAVHGTAMGLGRMMQGGHFPGDVLGAALAVYAVSLALVLGSDFFSGRRRPLATDAKTARESRAQGSMT